MIVSSSKFNFKETIDDIVRNGYLPEVVKAMEKVIPQVAKEAAKKLKAESPRRGGKYAKGWAAKTDKTRISVGATVYGKSGTYQLAHLLEHGHAKRNGGRTPAIEHIKPVEEWAIDKAYNDIMDELEGI